MHSEVSLMQNSRAFTEMLPSGEIDLMAQSLGDFANMEDQNVTMRQEIDEMERLFSQTDNQFFNNQRENLEMESEFETYQIQAEHEIDHLAKVVQAKESELDMLQRRLDKTRNTHTSGFSIHNQSLGMNSEAESVRTQLMDLNENLENEKHHSKEVLSKQQTELEEATKKAEDGEEQQKKMKTRMTDL